MARTKITSKRPPKRVVAPAPEVPEDAPPAPEVPEDAPPAPEVPEDAPPAPEVPEDAPPEPEVPEDAPPAPEVPEDAPPAPEVPEDGAIPPAPEVLEEGVPPPVRIGKIVPPRLKPTPLAQMPARKNTEKKKVRKESKSGLVFPVGRIARQFKRGQYTRRLGAAAPVYMAAVLEYLTAEMLELAGNQARDAKAKRITPRHIRLSVDLDDELAKLLKHVVLPSAGVTPRIQKVLIEGHKDKKKTKKSPK